VLLPLALAWDVSMGVDNLFSLSAFEIFWRGHPPMLV
jgi:hypothetical protein